MDYILSRRFGLTVAVVVWLADAFVKSLVLQNRSEFPLSVVDNWFALVLAWNRGMSFSLLSDADWWGPWFLGTVAVLASAVFIHWMGEKPEGRAPWLQPAGLGLIVGGAIGNLADRIQHGAVVDYLLFYHNNWAFPAFNLADSAITLGVVLLLAHGLWYGRKR